MTVDERTSGKVKRMTTLMTEVIQEEEEDKVLIQLVQSVHYKRHHQKSMGSGCRNVYIRPGSISHVSGLV